MPRIRLGASALDRISKRPNLKLEFERSTNNALNNNIARRQGRLFYVKNIKLKTKKIRSKRSTSIPSKAEPTCYSTQLFLKMINC